MYKVQYEMKQVQQDIKMCRSFRLLVANSAMLLLEIFYKYYYSYINTKNQGIIKMT